MTHSSDGTTIRDGRRASVAVLIPCYNEALTIGKVVDDFRRVLPDADIYVYDNNSSDATGSIAAEHGAIVRTERRQGKKDDADRIFCDHESAGRRGEILQRGQPDKHPRADET